PTSGNHAKYNLLFMAYDRFKLMTINTEILRLDPNFRNTITGFIFTFFLIVQILNKKFRKAYLLFIYYYVGYFVTTFINRGPILYFYFFPFFPLIFLIFSSFVTSKYSKVFIAIFIVIYAMNLHTAYTYILDSKKTIDKEETSWKFLNNMG